ncbi:MAG: TMEM165/GDT1 family protein [Synechococcus sp.]|nr:TMEM165/GDT1 family protein [Synechococcus sp.]
MTASHPPTQERSWSIWTVFGSTFLTIFIAEMGDKTQLATLLISAQAASPWVVFLGAALALVSTSLLGVVIGYWLARKLAPDVLDMFVGVLLLIIAGLLIVDMLAS